MTRIVTHSYLSNRSPRQKTKAAVITEPAIVRAISKQEKGGRQTVADDGQEASPEIKAFFRARPAPDDGPAGPEAPLAQLRHLGC